MSLVVEQWLTREQYKLEFDQPHHSAVAPWLIIVLVVHLLKTTSTDRVHDSMSIYL